jgi:hypothetical protein
MRVLLPVAIVALVLALASLPVSGATVPSAPLNLAADAGNQQVMLTWDPPATDGGSAITNYLVYRDTVPGLGFNEWANKAPATAPSARCCHAMAYDTGSGKVVLFGGDTGGGETWVYDVIANTWTDKAPGSAPSARDHHAMAYEAASGKVVLFGGRVSGGGAPNAETWVYDVIANTWTDKAPATAPSARFGHAMAYDAANGKVVLFGGGVATVNDETWVYDLAANTWTIKSPSPAPSARYHHEMAYDAASGKIVLFGGDLIGSLNGDTWVYDVPANTWTMKSPSPAPSPRFGHAMAYDAASGKVALFGGSTGVVNAETWVYDVPANTWTDKAPATSPSARHSPAMAYDAASGKVVLFGGDTGGGVPNGETWVYPSATPIATLGNVFTYTDAGLTNGVTYYYRVAARNAVGLGPTSNEVSATPDVTMLILGFYHPVDMGGVLNTVKNGATVPLKFEVFEGATEWTDTSVVQSLTLKQVACNTGLPSDAIEITATGGTSLRYDTTAGQFVYNWKTPNMGNTCWDVTLTVVDGSSITAHFKLR